MKTPPRPLRPSPERQEQLLHPLRVFFTVRSRVLTLDPNEALTPTLPPPIEQEGDEEKEEGPFVVVEQMPEPVGGMRAIYEYIEYPEFARKAGIEGTVYVRFTVDEQGNVSNVVIQRGVHELLNREALEAIRRVTFTPGRQRGRAVKVRMSLPVHFELR